METICGPCSKKPKRLAAEKYCWDCEEKLCTECAEWHLRWKAFEQQYFSAASLLGFFEHGPQIVSMMDLQVEIL
jgi:predicted amidophosphoribosyltransferase